MLRAQSSFPFLMTDESLTSLAKKVPDLLDYTNQNNLIDFKDNIDKQLSILIGLTDNQLEYIKHEVRNIRQK